MAQAPINPQANNTPNTKKKFKPIFFLIGGIALAVTIISIMTSTGNKSSEEKITQELSKNENTTSVQQVGGDEQVLLAETTGEEAEKLKKAQEIQREEAAANGQSNIDLMPNTQNDSGAIQNPTNGALVNIPQPENTQPVTSQNVTEAPLVQPPVAAPQPTVVQVNVPEQRVYEVTVRKEVPVLRYAPYTFTKDTEVLNHFAKQYDTSGVFGVSGMGGSGGGNAGAGGQMGAAFGGSKIRTGSDIGFGAKHREQLALNASLDQKTPTRGQISAAHLDGETVDDMRLQNNTTGSHSVNIGGQGQGAFSGSTNNNTNAGNKGRSNTQQVSNREVSIAKVGDILAAELETNIDSRRPTLVRARIVEGDLSGAIIIGSFTKNGDGSSLLIEFHTMNHPNLDRSVPIKGLAIDLNTGSNAMAHYVNRHTMARVSYAMVETMATAFATTLSTNNQTSSQRTVIDTLTGNASTVSENSSSKKSNKDILKEGAAAGLASGMAELQPLVPQEPTVKVHAAPFGLFITEDFKLPESEAYELGGDRW